MKKIGIILTPDNRSKAYIQKIISHKIKLEKIILMDDGKNKEKHNLEITKIAKKCGFDINEEVKDSLVKNNLEFIEFDFIDINHKMLIDYISHSNIDYFLFSGGGILRAEILNSGSKFVHFHPGIVPEYRGSTCFYYTIINENIAGVTAFIMEEGLDTGKIILQKRFHKPNFKYLDEVYDPFIRSETLIDVLENHLIEKQEFKEQKKNGETYFIIHPVLKHISILSCLNS